MPTNFLPEDPFDLAILASGILLLLLGVVLLTRRRRGAVDPFPFVGKAAFAEPVSSWLPMVHNAVRDDGLVVPALPMPKLLEVAEGLGGKRGRHAAAELARRQVDFAVFDPETLEPKVALLLQTPGRPRTFCRGALGAAGWRVVALPAESMPTAAELRELLFATPAGPELEEEDRPTDSWALGEVDAGVAGEPEWVLGDGSAPEEEEAGRLTTGDLSADSWPSCPLCGAKQTLRRAQRGRYAGRTFLVCSRYPTCRQLQPVRERDGKRKTF